MPERSSISQVMQIGVETTPGTAVAASKLLQSMSLAPTPNISTRAHRPHGKKYPTIQTVGKDWSEGDIEGIPTYDELAYVFSSIFGAATITTPGDAPTARTWTFNPATSVEDVPKTFTIEVGSAVRAHRVAYGLFTEAEIEFNREEVNLGGSFVAQNLQDGVTLTAAPTELPNVPILGSQMDVFMDTTSAGLGTTKLTRVLGGTWNVSDKYNPFWVVDSSKASYAGHVETEPGANLELTVEADAEGQGFLTNLRSGATRFVRLQAQGAIIGGATRYLMQIDMAMKVMEPSDFSDEDGVYATGYTLRAFHDATWGKAITAKLVNTLTAL